MALATGQTFGNYQVVRFGRRGQPRRGLRSAEPVLAATGRHQGSAHGNRGGVKNWCAGSSTKHGPRARFATRTSSRCSTYTRRNPGGRTVHLDGIPGRGFPAQAAAAAGADAGWYGAGGCPPGWLRAGGCPCGGNRAPRSQARGMRSSDRQRAQPGCPAPTARGRGDASRPSRIGGPDGGRLLRRRHGRSLDRRRRAEAARAASGAHRQRRLCGRRTRHRARPA